MSQHLTVHLSEADRSHLDNLIRKGICSARVQTRARILLLSDRSQGDKRPQKQVAEATLTSTLTVCRVCRRYTLQGLETALSEKPRPGKAPKITGDIEAHLVLLACSNPPEGQARWTFKLLADKLVALELVDSISEVAVYKRLKKRAQTVEGSVLVHR